MPSEADLIAAALRALRRESDARRALAQLAEHRRRFARGAFTEDALALTIEASIAIHDRARAREAAGAYLRAYPDGRHIDLARSIPKAGELD